MTYIIHVLFVQPDTPTQLAEDLKAVIEGDNRPFASYRKSSKTGGCDSGYMTVGKRTADKEVSSSQVTVFPKSSCVVHGDEYSVQLARLVLSDKFTVFKVNSQCVIHCTYMKSL